jgi:formate hydrogenlyase subunit 3/multisubunit Na+/H+ antiporter MnhD subunit
MMFLTAPVLLVVILLLGASLSPLTKRIARAQVRDGLTLCFISSFFLVSLFLYRQQPTAATISVWRPAPHFAVELSYYVDSLSLLFCSLTGFIMLVAILSQSSFFRSGEENRHPYDGGIFLLMAGGVSLMLAADLVTLYISWGFLDLGLLFLTGLLHRGKGASRTGLRILVVNYLAGMALLTSLLLLERLGVSFSLQVTLLPSKVISLVLFAALVRLGLYPALVALPADMEMSLPTVIAWYVIPLSAGGYLLARVLTLVTATSLWGREVVLFLGTLALIVGPFPLWFETSLRRTASYIVLNQVGYLALASAIAAPHSLVIVVSQVVSLALALGLLFLGQVAPNLTMSRSHNLWMRSCGFAAVATLVGTPLTVGFVSRWLLYQSLWGTGLGILIILALAANSFLLAPLLKMFLGRSPPASEQGKVSPLLMAGMGGLAIPLVILGLHPPLMSYLVGLQSALPALTPLPNLIYSTPLSLAVAMMAGMLLSLSLGYLMYARGEIIVARAGVSLETLQMIAERDWLYRALGWTVQRVALMLEQLGGFFEERRSLGWILLFALLIALLLLSS